MIIAIDGPAASGKSTVAKLLAERLGAHYLDTGAIYRAVALKALRTGTHLDDADALGGLARTSTIAFEHVDGSAIPTAVLLDGDDVTLEIRTPDVDTAVSAVASSPLVRSAMIPVQHAAAEGPHDVVVEGRDIGTVVFPQAGVKVFLTASPEERARRRHEELERRGVAIEQEAVRSGIERRDEADSTREAAPLVPAEDAVHVDTTGLTIDQVVESIARLVERAR